MRVLVVGAEDGARGVVARVRDGVNGEVRVAGDGATARAIAAAQSFDVILVESGDGDGSAAVTALRDSRITFPIVLVTHDADDGAIVRALDGGADDVVTTPVSDHVLLARLRAAARRASPQAELNSGALRLHRLARRVFVRDTELVLTAKEFSLLEHLLLHRGRMVRRTELLTHVWQMDFDPGSNVVDVHVMRLRRKLRESGATLAIHTVRGRGFELSEHGAPSDGAIADESVSGRAG